MKGDRVSRRLVKINDSKMASKRDSGANEMTVSILYCSLEGVMEAQLVRVNPIHETILEVKRRFTSSVDWRTILGESTVDSKLADALMSIDYVDIRKGEQIVWESLYNLVFDHMALEDDATPYGLGLVDGDKLALSRKKDYCNKEYVLNNKISLEYMSTGTLHIATNEMSKRNTVHTNIVAMTKRKAEEISVGLNVLIGEPDGLPIIQGDCFSHPTPEAAEICETQLKNMETALLPALGMTMKDCNLPLPKHLPDFSPILSNLLDRKYRHSHDCMKDITNTLRDYKTSAFVVANADIKYGGVDGKEEGAKREMILKRLKATVKEFQFATSSIHSNDISIENNNVYYVGPARNSNPENFLSSLPIVQLKGVAANTTLQDLLHSYKTYTENTGFKVPSLLYDNETHKLESKVNTVCTHPYPGFNKFYFAFPYDPSIKQEDNRDINDLLEFIEGDEDKKSSEKKKKKKKKRKILSSPEEKYSETSKVKNELIPKTESTRNLSQREKLTIKNDLCNKLDTQAQISLVHDLDNEARSSQEKTERKEEKKPGREEDLTEVGIRPLTKGPLESEEDKYLFEITQAISKRVEVELEVKKTRLDTLQAEKVLLEKSLENEQKQFETHKDNVQSIIDSKAKEMKNVLVLIEKTEDEKNVKAKKATDIDSKLFELEAQMMALKSEKNKLIGDCEMADDQIKKFTKKKNKLENFIGSELEKAKKEGNKIESNIQDLEQKITENSRSLQNLPNEQITYTKVKAIEPNKQLLDFIDKQIEEKEKELECPVCFEIATIPIFMCLELHLICSNCRSKIFECPECRLAYSGKPKRHRYAEKAVEELNRLKSERQELLKHDNSS